MANVDRETFRDSVMPDALSNSIRFNAIAHFPTAASPFSESLYINPREFTDPRSRIIDAACKIEAIVPVDARVDARKRS